MKRKISWTSPDESAPHSWSESNRGYKLADYLFVGQNTGILSTINQSQWRPPLWQNVWVLTNSHMFNASRAILVAEFVRDSNLRCEGNHVHESVALCYFEFFMRRLKFFTTIRKFTANRRRKTRNRSLSKQQQQLCAPTQNCTTRWKKILQTRLIHTLWIP